MSNNPQVNDIYNELSKNFIEYAAAVNTDRAIPDAKSGLKPVAKRILYESYNEGFFFSKAHVKCANIVGNVMAHLHPHGDASIYDALVRLAQPWVMRYPLIDFHGNCGNRDGDPPAAYRYTEARLSKISEDGLLSGIKKNTVDFIPNYSETMDEPVTLPAIFPNLLCNPNTGIGVALACNWLPHNLKEVSIAINDYIDGKEPTLPGPDFPTGGIIINAKDIPSIIATGHGSVKVRGKYTIEKNNIVFTEIPYGLITENLMDDIGAACDEGKVKGVTDIRNESDKNGFRLVIVCDKDANIPTVINELFKETNLQLSISYNQVALIDKVPTEMNLKDCIKVYVDHNSECIKREAEFDITKTKAKLHITIGLIKALDIIDEIITMIKSSESASKAKDTLINRWEFSEEQAKAILDMKLSKLAKLEKENLELEKKELEELLVSLETIYNNPIPELRKRLADIVNKYGDVRRTELTQLSETKEEKEIEFVEPEKCVVVLTESGCFKRIPVSSFKTQRKGGKGVKSQDDITSEVIRTNTIDNLMIFTNQGRMYKILVDSIPEGTNSSKGTPIKSIITMEPGEEASVIYSVYRDTDATFVMFVTKNGLAKKTALNEYINTKKKTGIGAIQLKDGDELAAVTLIKDEPLLIVTKNGYTIKFDSKEVGATSRLTSGVKGITLGEDDEVIAALPVRDTKDDLCIISTTGLGKRVKLEDILSQKRAGKGLCAYKTGQSAGDVAAAQLINDNDFLLITGSKSNICISGSEIPILSRTAIGNILFKGGRVASISKV